MMRACGSANARRHPHADRTDRRIEELHRVVDRHPRAHTAARGVDVDVDVALGIVRIEEQQLGNDDVGDIIVDRRAEENDAVHEEPREDVVRALATARPFDDVRGIDGHLRFSF
jgi:hypothetical protein